MKKDNKNSEENKFPSVSLAYDIALKSYDWQINRLNEADKGIENLLLWISTVTIGSVTLIITNIKNVDTHSICYCISLIAGLSIFIGIVRRTSGYLKIISPAILLNEYLTDTEWEFKKNILYDTEIYFTENTKLINNKGWVRIIMSYLFLLEIVVLFIWILSVK